MVIPPLFVPCVQVSTLTYDRKGLDIFMDIKKLSKTYHVIKLSEQDLPAVLALCQGNPQYYRYCPPAVSTESLLADMQALPPGKTLKDKYYIGFFCGDKLAAVMDLILEYPDKKTAFIGFFMMNADMQGKGCGSAIVEDVCRYLAKKFSYIRLGYVKGNKQSEQFWIKNGFAPTGAVSQSADYEIIVMQKRLSGMKTASKIALSVILSFYIPLLALMLVLVGIVFLPIVKYGLKLYPSQDYRQIEGAEEIVFWDSWNYDPVPYRRGFWGLKRIQTPVTPEIENDDEYDCYDYKVYDISGSGRWLAYYDNKLSQICLYDTKNGDEKCLETVQNSVSQIVFSPDEKYILYKEIEYGGETTDDEYCYYYIIDTESLKKVTIYEGYREWYTLQW